MTVIDILARRAATEGEARAFTWVADGERADVHVTFGELHARASSVATLLAGVATPGDRAMLLHADALDFIAAFLGCLMAGVIAVPVYPPNPARLAQTRARFLAVVDDARPAVLLTTRALAPLCAPLAAERAIAVVCPEVERASGRSRLGADDAPPAADVAPASTRDVAFLQYTSGSTASPKGVVVTHANILANLEMIRTAYALDARSRFVSWLPLYHDMGLMAGVLGPLVWGAHSVLLPPWRVLERPVRWLQAIARHRADASPAPNFGFDLAARKVTDAEVAELDLSTWRVALTAAEPVRPATLARFTQRFAPAGFDRAAFYPTYGLAEATVFACAAPRRSEPVVIHADADALAAGRIVHGGTRAFVALGGVTETAAELRIVAGGREVARGEVGEIWLAGPHIAAGYWQNGEATAAAFGARLPTTEARFLRTGDLGFVDGGELFVVGRMKDLLIVNGKNHAPEDVEYAVAQACPQLRPGALVAFGLDDGTDERVVLVAEAAGPVDVEAVARAARVAADVSIHTVAIVAAGQVPKTSSGKVQRGACRRAYVAGELTLVGVSRPTTATNTTHAYLREVLAQVLAVRPETIDPTHAVRGLGLDSLKAVELKMLIEDDRGLEVRLEELPATATLDDLAALLDGRAPPRVEVVRTGSAWDAFTVLARAEPDALALVTATRRWTREQLVRAPVAALAAAARSGHATTTPPARAGELYAMARGSEPAIGRAAIAALGAGAVVAFVDDADTDPRTFVAPPLQVGVQLFPAGEPRWFANLERLARTCDDLGFHAIWLPERHFHAFGAPAANPSVLAAAIAGWTSRIRIRAGSVVLPLHHPLRVVEEWAMVDQLSGGRVDLAFAAGRNVADFVLAPEAYTDRRERLRDGVATVRSLWRGEPFHGRDGLGVQIAVVPQPRPVQPELPVWLTTSARPETFELAGAIGANVLTALMEHELDALAANIAAYRRTCSARGHVSVMLHTYLDEDAPTARAVAGPAFKAYLRAFLALWHRRDEAHAFAAPTPREAEAAVELGFERYARRAALFGGEAAARERLGELQAAGVDEVACLVDFGVEPEALWRGLERLARVRDAMQRLAAAPLPAIVRR